MRPTKSESLLLQGQVTQTSALTADQPQPRRVTPEPQKKLQCNQPAWNRLRLAVTHLLYIKN